jgi:hypothetical protein
MKTSARHCADLAASAHQLQRAAGFFQQHASARDTVANLPVALAHVEEALDRLATGMTIAAHAVEEWPPYAGPERDVEESPGAHALRWHLFHLARRLRGAQDSCVDPRRMARTLLEHARTAHTADGKTASTAPAEDSALGAGSPS